MGIKAGLLDVAKMIDEVINAAPSMICVDPKSDICAYQPLSHLEFFR